MNDDQLHNLLKARDRATQTPGIVCKGDVLNLGTGCGRCSRCFTTLADLLLVGYVPAPAEAEPQEADKLDLVHILMDDGKTLCGYYNRGLDGAGARHKWVPLSKAGRFRSALSVERCTSCFGRMR